MPGVWRKGIQNSKTNALIMKVVWPMVRSVWMAIPCAKTVQGLTPTPAAINMASPSPNRICPVTSMIKEIKGGRRVRGRGDVQANFGMAVIFKKPGKEYLFFIYCSKKNIFVRAIISATNQGHLQMIIICWPIW